MTKFLLLLLLLPVLAYGQKIQIQQTDGSLKLQTLSGGATISVGGVVTLGAGGGITLDATLFNGNLDAADNTFQEIAQKLDDLTFSGTFGETSLAGLVNSQTLWNGASASRTLTFALSGATDPVLTFSNGLVSLSTATGLSLGGAAIGSNALAVSGAVQVTGTINATAFQGNGSGVTGLDVANLTGGIGAGVQAWLGTPSSANFRGALTDESGTGFFLTTNGDGSSLTATGLTTQLLVGGGSGVIPVWTTATGTGAPVRANGPTFTGGITVNGDSVFVGALQVDAFTCDTINGVSLIGSGSFDLGANSLTITGGGTVALGGFTLTVPATGTAALLGAANTFTAVNTFTPAARASGVASYFVLNAPADTGITAATESIGVSLPTATRAWADGTTTLQRERFFAGPTYNKTTTSAVFTDAFNTVFTPVVFGTGVTGRAHSVGILDSTSAASSVTGGLVVATTFGTAATSVGIGGGNVNAGGFVAATYYSLEPARGLLIAGAGSGLTRLTNSGGTGPIRLSFGTETTNYPALSTDAVNGITFVSGSTASPATWNDPSTAASGTVANRYLVGIAAPTLTATAATTVNTVASTVYIGGAPVSGDDLVITTPYALNVAAGNAIFGGNVTVTGTLSGSNVTSGTYTPTLYAGANVAASQNYLCQYLRVGNTVTVSGKLDIDATLSASTDTEIGIQLPVASALTAEEGCAGDAASTAIASLVGIIKADAANDRASINFKSLSLSNDSWFFTFTYRVQ